MEKGAVISTVRVGLCGLGCYARDVPKKPQIIDAEYSVVTQANPKRLAPDPPWWAFGEAPGGGFESLVRILVQLAILFAFLVLCRMGWNAYVYR